MNDRTYHANAAVEDFRRAWQRGQLQDITSRLTGRTNDLLSYEEVRQKLRASVSSKRVLQDIPLAAIVGSVGRYTDFTRTFLPRVQRDSARWANVLMAMQGPTGTPPIEVYQIGDVYFVLDGNHRVSVARQLGSTHIQAYVTEVHTRVPIAPDISPDELIRKAEYAGFLEWTNLDVTRPGATLDVTNPGQYDALGVDIADKRQELAGRQGRDVPLVEAASAWFDDVYLPIVGIIRDRGLLQRFPGRTETDLYVWISRHRARLEASLGWEVNPGVAAQDFIKTQGHPSGDLATDVSKQLLQAVTPAVLEAGPPPGQWRMERNVSSPHERLVADVLVAVSGDAEGWYAVEQALVVVQRETGRLHGVHVVRTEAARHSPEAQAVRDQFERRCQEAGVTGNLGIEVGSPAEIIGQWAHWNDLVVVSLAHPPGSGPIARLRSGFHALVQHCPRPILTVPQTVVSLRSVLLSYDGSPKATEALYVAAYLALQWHIPLVVLTVLEGTRTTDETQEHARRYLEAHGVAAVYRTTSGPNADAILRTAEECGSDVILIGGYGHRPLLETVLGSTVDQLLRESRRPLLICR